MNSLIVYRLITIIIRLVSILIRKIILRVSLDYGHHLLKLKNNIILCFSLVIIKSFNYNQRLTIYETFKS